MKWQKVENIKDLPQRNGDFLVSIRRNSYFFEDYDDRIFVVAAVFDLRQKVWIIEREEYVNALIPIFDFFDAASTDHVTHWANLPEAPKEEA